MPVPGDSIARPRRGPARADTIGIMVRVDAAELVLLDAWIDASGPPYVSRPEAIRRLVHKAIG